MKEENLEKSIKQEYNNLYRTIYEQGKMYRDNMDEVKKVTEQRVI